MTGQQHQIARYIAQHPVFAPYLAHPQEMGQHVIPARFFRNLPTAEELAGQLLADSEFQALKLGGWLGTTEGKVIAEAVSLVIPPAYGPVFNLAVDALTIAAKEQFKGHDKVAAGILVGALLLLLSKL